MELKIKIATFDSIEGLFKKTGYVDYLVTFNNKPGEKNLKLLVNGVLTEKKIRIKGEREGQAVKQIILSAIREYNEMENKVVSNLVAVTKTYIKKNYKRNALKYLRNNVLQINKEESRDVLTKFNLINIK